MATGQYQIPFDESGNQRDYHDGYCTLKDNFEFKDTLTFEAYGRGRSSVTFTMRRKSNGKSVSMFISNFTEIVPLMNAGMITGRFTFVKKGGNYGCKMLFK